LYAHRSRFRKRHILSRTFKDGTIDFYKYYNDDGKLVTSTKTINKKYNAEDKLIELVTLNELTNKINTQVFEYNYDVNGNIIKQICYDNDGNILLQYINEYEYYK
jgi:hypothetical protein